MTRLGLTHRFLIVTLVTLAPLATLVFFNIYVTRQTAWQTMHETARRTGSLHSLELVQVVTGIESVLNTVASSPSVRRKDRAVCETFLSTAIGKLPQLVALSVLDGRGQPLCRAGNGTLPALPDAAILQQASVDGGSVTGRFVPGADGTAPTLPVLMAFVDDTNARLTIIGDLDLGWLGRRMKRHELAAGSSITVADSEGTIVAREPLPERFVGTQIPASFSHLVTAPEPGSMAVVSQDGTARVIGYFPASPQTKGFYVSAGVAVDEVLGPINRITAISILIGLLTTAAAVIAGQIANERFIRRPFARLIGTVNAWQAGDTTVRTGLQRDASEFGEAGRALDGFMDQLLAARAQRQIAEEQRALLLREHDHRMKNLIATVQAIARQTFRGRGQDDNVRAFNGRLGAMAKAHEVLLSGGLTAASVTELIRTAVAPFDDANHARFTLSGPDFDLADKAATALAMALHELSTNAAKYGALSTPEGKVDIRWSLDGTAKTFSIDWVETGGPPVTAPDTSGFGTTMIRSVLAQQIAGSVDIDYLPDGLRCRMVGETTPA
ncbi:HWE histidine kinase domain-containing protein [Tabrizicola sp. BL-A-41-H6]|uniref:HWE histidine kinase domain-containing protein n=1 Tax=Tabrizicola sp. BL-A-41-H6 TaxID=3421107 RepID=UPI003D678D53